MLIELPNGDFIDPRTVKGIRTLLGDKIGPRVVLDAATSAHVLLIKFDLPEAAREWARDFAAKVNACAPEPATS